MDKGWKIAIVVLWILFILQNVLFIWGAISILQEEEKIYQCYFNICSEYEDVDFVDDICTCYEYNYKIEDYEIKKQIYMK